MSQGPKEDVFYFSGKCYGEAGNKARKVGRGPESTPRSVPSSEVRMRRGH